MSDKNKFDQDRAMRIARAILLKQSEEHLQHLAKAYLELRGYS